MPKILFNIICVIIGYGIGCIQTAYIFGRIVGRLDIRGQGSGNAGTTNIARVFGVAPGIFVFFVDFFKAILAFFICGWIASALNIFDTSLLADSYNPDFILPGFYGGVGVLLGHNFPAFLKFAGGKGIASSLGLMFCVDWRIASIVIAIGAIFLFTTRYISLFSIIVLIIWPILLFVLYQGYWQIFYLGLFMALMALWRHRGNIQRIKNGTERKFSFKKEGIKP